jgi:hypothetical protein
MLAFPEAVTGPVGEGRFAAPRWPGLLLTTAFA